MSQISVSQLTFAYPGSYDYVFENVSFQIDTQWKLGFIGRNGRGKTTFLRLLQGQYDYGGQIAADVEFSYFPLAVADPAQSAGQVARALAPAAEEWQLERELSLLALDLAVLAQPFATLSHGEQTKLLLAALFLRENSFLLIDEPTDHLDMQGRALLARYLARKSGYILVSHDRALLDGCVDHILAINKTNIEVQQGNFSSWQLNKERQDAFEQAENAKLGREAARLEQAARETVSWSDAAERRKVGLDPRRVDVKMGYAPKQAAKSAKLMRRAKATAQRQSALAAEKEQLLHNVEQADVLKMHPLRWSGGDLVQLHNVSLSYGDRSVLRDLSFAIAPGERVALLGGNGCGKSSVIRLILGQATAQQGAVYCPGRMQISSVPQDAAALSGSLRDYARCHQLEESLFLAALRQLGLPRVQFERDLAEFSAGQRKKVLLAQSLCEPAHLFIWDEPLNYIDVISRIQLEQLLLLYEPTLLFVEHDREFCRRVATRSVQL